MTSEQKPPTTSKGSGKIWLPVVLVIGFLVGAFISLFVYQPQCEFWGCVDYGPSIQYHVILSTVSVALIVSLALVYVRVYLQTSARFALALVIVLWALLVQALFQYPLLLGLEGPFGVGQGAFLSYADVFTITAYAIFLYISLD